MARPLSQTFVCQPLRDLAAQLDRSPAAQRVEQMRNAERLHDEIDAAQNYPLSFLVFRLTHTRPTVGRETILAGQAIRPDLRLLIDKLSRSIELVVDPQQERVWTVEALAAHAKVSAKTIQRWRRDGLRWRQMMFEPDGRRTVCIPDSAWRHFAQRYPKRVSFAGSFTQIPDDQRRDALRRARRIAERCDVTLNQVAGHLARRADRALETFRQLLEKHDRDHPDDRIFIDRTGPLTQRQHQIIARAHGWGIPVQRIAHRFGRTPNTIYRILHQRRAADLRRISISYVPSPLFERDDAVTVLLREALPELELNTSRPPDAVVAQLPAPLAAVYDQPTLDDKLQSSLFVRYNFLKYHCDMIRQQLHRQEPRTSEMNDFDRYRSEAHACRLLLVRVNLPTVLSVARRQLISRPEPTPTLLFTLLEAGNVELYEVIEQHNSRLRLAFSSVLRNRLLGRYARDAAANPDPTHAARRDESQRCVQRMIRKAARYDIDLQAILAARHSPINEPGEQ